MDLTQLEYFQAVARHQNITKAAKELYVSQPTLSQSISRLESNLGVELFDRVNGKLYLNEAGRMFLSRVDKAFAELSQGFSELDHYKEAHQDWVYIASSVIDIFKSVILEYMKVRPDIHIDHSLTSDRNIMDLLMNSKVDFAITPTPIYDPKISCVPLYEEEVFAVVGRTHPLSAQTTVTLAELANYPMVCNNCDSDISFVEEMFGTDRRNLDIIATSSESPIPRTLTQQGRALGFIPGRVAVGHLKKSTPDQIPLRIVPSVVRTTCISSKRSHQLSTSAKSFYQFILDFCKEENQDVRNYIKVYYGE